MWNKYLLLVCSWTADNKADNLPAAHRDGAGGVPVGVVSPALVVALVPGPEVGDDEAHPAAGLVIPAAGQILRPLISTCSQLTVERVELETNLREFTITEKAPMAFSLLKAPTHDFTFKTLFRHYAKQT